MSQRLDGELPAVYLRWVEWLFASPENIASFRRDPIATTRAAGIQTTPDEMRRLLQAVEYVERVGRGSR